MKELLIGIDIGTTGIRSIVYDTKMNEVGKSYRSYPLINLSAKMIEQDANVWWEITQETITEAMKQASGEVCAISISSQGIAYVPVDQNCIPIRNAISWLDSRAEKQTKQILERFSEQDIYKITGKRVSSYYTLPKIMWLKQNEPENYNKAYKFLLPHDFLIAKLSGEFVTDHTLAAGTMIYDINDQCWSAHMLDSFDIDADKLPVIVWGSTAVGKIIPEVAEVIGLRKDVTICVGGQDQKCASFGSGISTGIATVSLGTAAAIEKIWATPYIDEKMHIPCFSFLYKNAWVTEGVLNTAAASMRWLKETLFEAYTYDQMSSMVNDQEYKTDLSFYPYLAGCATPNWYKSATGLFDGIHLNTSRGDFVRALFEGIAMQIKSNLEIMEGTDEIRIFGGGATSGIWCKIIADVTGSVVKTLHTTETACFGAAMLAGIGCEIFKDCKYASQFILIKDTIKPDVKRHSYYNEKYKSYTNTEKRLWGEYK